MFPVAILAGGLATRLHPITETIPKALVEVAGKPFIIWQLSYLKKQGVTHVVICVGFLGEMIRDVVGNGRKFGLRVNYSEDGPNQLGTGGALVKATALLEDNFFVLYGDSFLPVNFSFVQEAYCKSKQAALMTILKNKNQWDLSNVLYQDGHIIKYSKHKPTKEMAHIDYGLGVLSTSVLENYFSEQSFDLADIYQDLCKKNKLASFVVHNRFYEIGSHAGLKETEQYLSMREKK